MLFLLKKKLKVCGFIAFTWNSKSSITASSQITKSRFSITNVYSIDLQRTPFVIKLCFSFLHILSHQMQLNEGVATLNIYQVNVKICKLDYTDDINLLDYLFSLTHCIRTTRDWNGWRKSLSFLLTELKTSTSNLIPSYMKAGRFKILISQTVTIGRVQAHGSDQGHNKLDVY